LWAWENRDANRVIESVRLEPAGRKFIVAAIALANLGMDAQRSVLLALQASICLPIRELHNNHNLCKF
jgi:hypothetical protein